ncbi:hypothetical protein L1987_49186 [Smallanthus sonchifolius]|uniref:Uncharacterized protein n=1 Tax=Smallanthus sonchifolius TaxID=185202 RepID=A0ACB9FVP2_9ASTR|nr:hypothetical protein L1987_49186 [Smallanthus sonchifolius]
MEIPEFKTLSQLPAMEDLCFNFQWPVNSVDDHLNSMHAHQFQAHAPLFECYEHVMEPSPRPTKQLKASDHSLMNQNLIHGSGCASQGALVKPKDEAFNENCYVFSNDLHGGSGGANMTSTRNRSRSERVSPYQDHLLAERKRREKLSQRFIALSALLPNLKKMDKASVLGDAIEYMKTLKEKVKILEEQTAKRANIESIRFEMVATDGGAIASSRENMSCFSEQFPEIKARFIGNEVLIRIHCEKKPGVLEKTLAEIEKLHLSVINSTAVIFANSILLITVIAQMDKDLTMTMKDFVRNLHFSLKQFM